MRLQEELERRARSYHRADVSTLHHRTTRTEAALLVSEHGPHLGVTCYLGDRGLDLGGCQRFLGLPTVDRERGRFDHRVEVEPDRARQGLERGPVVRAYPL